MSNRIVKFENAAVWLDGISLVGHVSELELPSLEWETVEHETLAFRGMSEYPQRMSALEATLTWADYSSDLANAASDPWSATRLQIRAAYGDYDGGSRVRNTFQIIDLSGRFKTNMLGTLTQGEMERESVMAVDYVKEVYNGQLVIEFGVNPPIYRHSASNTDLFAVVRSTLGL